MRMNQFLKNKHLLPLFIWTIIWALFFLTIIGGRQRLPTSDFTEQFHAFATFQAQEMRQGRLPLWSSHSFGGVPFVADPQTAVFYIPRWLTIFLSGSGDFPLYALELEALVHIWLAAVFTYALAFAITRERWAALLGAVSFGLGGYLISYPLLQLAVLETITWLPLALLLARLGATRAQSGGKTGPIPWFVGAGLALALSASAGHPQTFLHVGYVTAVYTLFLMLRARWRWRWVLICGAVTAVTALAVSTAYWLPVLRYFPFTTRVDADYSFIARGEPMLNYIQLIAPSTLSAWAPEYLGLVGAIFVLLAWFGRHNDKEKTAETLFWVVLALIAGWVALGDAGVLFQLFYKIAPGFSLFRQQERLLGVVSLSGAMLAAQGLALWLRLNEDARRQYLRRAGWILVISFLFVAIILFAARDKPSDGWPMILLKQIIIAALSFIILAVIRQRQIQAALLIFLLVGDLYLASLPSMARFNGSPDGYWRQEAWLNRFLDDYQQQTPARINSGRIFWSNAGEVYGWEDLSGISPVEPQYLSDLSKLPQIRRWRLLNVSHVFSETPLENEALTPLQEFQGGVIADRPRSGMIYRVEGTRPRAWMVFESLVIPDKAAALAQMGGDEFDPARQVILPESAAAAAIVAQSPGANTVPAEIVSPRPGQLVIQTETDAPGYLVISEWFYPGWRAVVDGAPVPLQRADVALMALPVPAGVHEIGLRFQPAAVSVGIAISFLTLLGAIVLAWRWRPVVKTAVTRPSFPSLPIPEFPAIAAKWQGRQTRFWLVIGVILLGVALRTFLLGNQELRGDEGISYGYALKPALDIVRSIRDRGDPHSPMHYLMLHGWMKLAGDSEVAMRVISLVPGILALPLAFQVGRRLVGRKMGLLLAGLMAISQSLVWISQDTRNQYTLTIAFSLLATYLLTEAVRRSTWRWWGLYALAAALTVYAHSYGIFALLAHGAYLAALPATRKQWFAWFASSLAAAALFLPWLLYSLPMMIAVDDTFGHPATPNLARHLVDVGVELAVGSALDFGTARWLFVGMLLLSFMGMRYLWRRRRPSAALLIAWLGTAVLGIYLVRFSRDTFNTYYVNVAAPAWWALVGAGLAAAWSDKRGVGRLLSLLGGTAVVAIAAVSLTNYYFDPEFSRSLGYRELIASLSEQAQPGDIIVANYPDASLSYYLKDVPAPHTMQPAVYQNADGQAAENLAALIDKYDRLWFVPVHRSNWDPEDAAFQWLDYNTLLEQEDDFDQITLSAYRAVSTSDQALAQINQLTNAGIKLEAAYLTQDGQPGALLQESPIVLSPNSAIEVSLVWQTAAEMSDNYTVFIHLRAEDGRLIAQHDGWAVFGTRPTFTWQARERILDKHRLTIPEGEELRASLIVGMYHSETGERLLFENGQDYLWLADVALSGSSPE